MNNLRIAVMAVGLTIGVLGLAGKLSKPSPVPAPAPSTGILDGVSAADAAEFRTFFATVAEALERDGRSQDPVMKTLFDFRARYRQALKLSFEGTPVAGKYPGLGAKLDDYELRAIGSLDVPLTPEERKKAADALRAIR